jgi:prepilin-type N-terminal cleavage/methylation domain-containing protein
MPVAGSWKTHVGDSLQAVPRSWRDSPNRDGREAPAGTSRGTVLTPTGWFDKLAGDARFARVRRPMARGNASGFSLLEVLIATTVLTIGLMSLAQLVTTAVRANQGSRATTYAVVLAQQKMEQLRGLAWTIDRLSQPVTDTTTDVISIPERPSGGTGLSPSPRGALADNTAGYCDFLDGRGESFGGGTSPPEGTVYIRRWSIEPLPANPGNSIVVQVLVTRWRHRTLAGRPGREIRLPDEARIMSVRTRKTI